MRKPFSRDPHSALEPVQDPIHGPINLGDGLHKASGVVRRLLKTQMVTRLRHVRQLGFASLGFPAADHMRFSHALGSMHMMRQLLEKLMDEDDHLAASGAALSKHFSHFKRIGKWGASERFDDRFYNHMLLAALLEDVGELPFAKATELVFFPEPSERAAVEKATQCKTDSWGAKEFFTMALINRALTDEPELREELSIELLALLITKNMPGGAAIPPGLRRLCHLVDGVVDADRLDYVYRDAYHTAGAVGSPSGVVQSLLFYDDVGPVFSDPEPVGAFLTMYANLWSTVYFSPQNRFRVIVLATLLQEIRRNRALAEQTALTALLNDGMPLDVFLNFDDRWLFERIGKLRHFDAAQNMPRVKATLQVLLDEPDRPDYDAVWVTPGNEKGPSQDPREVFNGRLFFDTFFNSREHTLYSQKKPVRIRSKLYSVVDSDLPLEKCEGPFAQLLDPEWRFTKRTKGILIFFPSDRKDSNRGEISSMTTRRSFHAAISNADPLQGAYPSDGRRSDFNPPAIFISYAVDDAPYVDRVCQQLHSLKQQYYYIPKNDCTANLPTREASLKIARNAGAALILLSRTYLDRYDQGTRDREGNIWEEVKVLVSRRQTQGLPIRFLSVDAYDDVRRHFASFPVAELTGQNPRRLTPTRLPTLGKALRSATAAEIGTMVHMILEGL